MKSVRNHNDLSHFSLNSKVIFKYLHINNWFLKLEFSNVIPLRWFLGNATFTYKTFPIHTFTSVFYKFKILDKNIALCSSWVACAIADVSLMIGTHSTGCSDLLTCISSCWNNLSALANVFPHVEQTWSFKLSWTSLRCLRNL